MQRRKFVQSALATSAALMSTAAVNAASTTGDLLAPKRQFKLKYGSAGSSLFHRGGMLV
jgi:hypothetical protein